MTIRRPHDGVIDRIKWVAVLAIAVLAALVAVATIDDSAAITVAMFVFAGITSAVLLRGPAAALVPLGAALIVTPVDLAVAEARGPFSDSFFVLMLWVALAVPAAVITLALGYSIKPR